MGGVQQQKGSALKNYCNADNRVAPITGASGLGGAFTETPVDAGAGVSTRLYRAILKPI